MEGANWANEGIALCLLVSVLVHVCVVLGPPCTNWHNEVTFRSPVNICWHWWSVVDVLSRPRDQSCRMSKIRRKVTVENSKTISDSSSSSSTTTTTTTTSTSNPAGPSRRPSVFERLGPSTGSNAADVRVQWFTLQLLIIHSDWELGAHPFSHCVCMFFVVFFFCCCFRVIAEIG